MTREPITIRETSDVTPEVLEASQDIFEGFFDNDGEPIDWTSFWDRLEAWGYCVEELDCPATRKIQRHIRKFREAS